MFMAIRKRDGREVSFDEAKITEAIFKAAKAVGKVIVPILKTAASIILKREPTPSLDSVSWKRSE